MECGLLSTVNASKTASIYRMTSLTDWRLSTERLRKYWKNRAKRRVSDQPDQTTTMVLHLSSLEVTTRSRPSKNTIQIMIEDQEHSTTTTRQTKNRSHLDQLELDLLAKFTLVNPSLVPYNLVHLQVSLLRGEPESTSEMEEPSSRKISKRKRRTSQSEGRRSKRGKQQSRRTEMLVMRR